MRLEHGVRRAILTVGRHEDFLGVDDSAVVGDLGLRVAGVSQPPSFGYFHLPAVPILQMKMSMSSGVAGVADQADEISGLNHISALIHAGRDRIVHKMDVAHRVVALVDVEIPVVLAVTGASAAYPFRVAFERRQQELEVGFGVGGVGGEGSLKDHAVSGPLRS